MRVDTALIASVCGVLLFVLTDFGSVRHGASVSMEAEADSVTPAYVDSLRVLIPRLLAAHDVPGLSIAVVEDRAIAWKAGFGVRQAGGAPVTPGTVFEAASLAKPVFAYGVLKLAREGRIDLDVPLATYLADFPSPDPRARRITARMVLSHTSGLPNWPGDEPLRTQFEPGTSWQYSGAAHRLLQRTVEAITGESLARFMRRTVLRPLGMARSSYVWRPAYDSTAATGHDAHGVPRPKRKPDTANAAGSLHTTATDYARFLRAILYPETGKLPPRDVHSMLAPCVGVDSSLGLSWGLGWAIEQVDGRRSFFHWGANPAFRAFAMGWPHDGRALVVLMNGANGLELMDEIVRVIDPHPHPLFSFYMMHPTD